MFFLVSRALQAHMPSLICKKQNLQPQEYLGGAALSEFTMNYLDVIVETGLDLKSEHLTLIFCPTTY